MSVKWQLSHLTKRELPRPRAKWEPPATSRRVPELCPGEGEALGWPQAPIPLTPLANKNIDTSIGFIDHPTPPPAAGQHHLAGLCHLHLLMPVSLKQGGEAQGCTVKHLAYSRLCRGGMARSSATDPGCCSPAIGPGIRLLATSDTRAQLHFLP